MTPPVRWWETRWMAAAVTLIAILPLLWPTIPPLTDLPGHIGRYRVMLGDDAAVLGQWYHYTWRLVGNLGVDLLVAGFAPWFGLEPTVKAIVIGTVAGTVIGTLWISRELHGRVSPFAFFALPLAYSYVFQFGFVNYTLAMALTLCGWALWLRLGRSGALLARALLFVPFGFVVWTAHVAGWAMLCLFAFGGEWARLRDRHDVVSATVRAGLATLPLAPPALLLVLWRSGDSGGGTGKWFDFAAKFEGLAFVLRDRWAVADLAAAALLLIVIAAAVRGWIGRIDRRAAAAAALAATAFLLLPFLLMGSAYADMRLLPYAIIVALAGIVPVTSRYTSRIALAGLIFFGVRTALTTASFALYDREWTRELAALDHIPRGARVLALVGESCRQPWAHRRLSHLPSLIIARRAAFANSEWRLEGAPILSVNLPGAGFFANDPSQVVVPRYCPEVAHLLPQKTALASFPRASFTHVWLIHAHPLQPGELSGMTVVWRDGPSMVLRIAPPPASRPLS